MTLWNLVGVGDESLINWKPMVIEASKEEWWPETRLVGCVPHRAHHDSGYSSSSSGPLTTTEIAEGNSRGTHRAVVSLHKLLDLQRVRMNGWRGLF